ncbi:hypothetical protein SAMN04488569_10923 [Marinilactibacillus piezotolerans]|uniref:Uncharacterized protein n=1 Tax=Marinilactibacillus piezotolerans TaxID=258723 RepID=A0A1I4C239_9LACT|nr:hypothetical protein [Marinilactibacillus piezotolerans]SFK74409.1 hypothetical protein SAMN04488569_10923 [Marinilactibacillus piezotolerans]
MSENKINVYSEIIDLEDVLNKLKSWENGLEFLGDYYSSNSPDLERLVEEYTPTSAIFWAFQRDFVRLNREAQEKLDLLAEQQKKLFNQ